ncbi:O-antigen ligase family protein [Ostreiculturibacter nitratireducens]|uniref:O-antigen ligase family protein n=1 Tax=Ostreiculturibacter nitratireducens TaxID=3075226 RepID=UPI0031B59997
MTERYLSLSTMRRAVTHEIAGLAYVMAVIFLIGSDFFNIVIGPGPVTAGGRMAMLGLLVVWIVRNLPSLVRGLVSAPELTAFIGLAMISLLWSAYPEVTLDKLYSLVITTFAAMTLGGKVSLRTLFIALGILALYVVVASFGAIAAIPEARGIPPWDNAWRGVFNHKNGLGGASMFMLIYSSAAFMVTTGRARTMFLLVAIGSATLLLASQSRTSQILALLSVGALFIGLAHRRWATVWAMSHLVIVSMVVGGAYVLFASRAVDPVFDLIGREPTLSGRLPLWAITWPHVVDRLWLGHGYSAFWVPTSQSVIDLSRSPTIGYIPWYSHNGLIETLLNTGVIGLALFVGHLLRTFSAIFNGFRIRETRHLIIVAHVIIVGFLLLNVTESSVLSRESLTWMVFVALSTKLAVIGNAAKRSLRRPVSLTMRRPESVEPAIAQAGS